jgi:hypothetical protein
MKDRFNLDVTERQFQALAKALNDGTLTEEQFNKYLAPLSAQPITYEPARRLPRDAQLNYSGMTFAETEPVSIDFSGDQIKLVLRVTSFTQPTLDNDGKRVVNNLPAEIFVTYRVVMEGGKVTLTRVENSYGVKPVGEEDPNLSQRDRIRRSTLLTKTLPRRFFGIGDAPTEDEDPGAEPFFPPQKESTGLTLRGRWKRLGELPWTQIGADNGWLALGWAMPNTPPAPSGAE